MTERRLILQWTLLLALSWGGAAPASEEAGHPFITGGYQEVVLSVSDLNGYVRFFREVAGYRVVHDGPSEPGWSRLWQLPLDSRWDEVLLGNPGTSRGYVRLIRFQGLPQLQIRSNAQSWDTGGWFDANIRILDMESKFRQLQARNWQSVSDPVQFSFGPFVVKEWLARGPDGVVLAMIERVQPPLEGWPQLREFSRFFNATQIVSDIGDARRFYVDQLGFQVYLESHRASAEPGPNVLGLPHNLSSEIRRHVYIVHPEGSNEGSVELLSYDGATGADFSGRAVPPNLGILMLRFPVRDMPGFIDFLGSRGVVVESGPVSLALPPYGRAQVLSLPGPDGALLEFYQLEQH